MAAGAPVIFSNPVVPTLVEEEDVGLVSVFIKALDQSIKSKGEKKCIVASQNEALPELVRLISQTPCTDASSRLLDDNTRVALFFCCFFWGVFDIWVHDHHRLPSDGILQKNCELSL